MEFETAYTESMDGMSHTDPGLHLASKLPSRLTYNPELKRVGPLLIFLILSDLEMKRKWENTIIILNLISL